MSVCERSWTPMRCFMNVHGKVHMNVQDRVTDIWRISPGWAGPGALFWRTFCAYFFSNLQSLYPWRAGPLSDGRRALYSLLSGSINAVLCQVLLYFWCSDASKIHYHHRVARHDTRHQKHAPPTIFFLEMVAVGGLNTYSTLRCTL